jgi:hypothetical protein
MSDLITMMSAAAGQVGGEYQISRSLRFNSADSAYLSRTPASEGDRKTWTWSAWVKRSGLGTADYIFSGSGAATGTTAIRFETNNTINFYTFDSVYTARINTSQVFRDVSSWYHIVAVFNTDSATTTLTGSATDRLRLYINGVQVSAFSDTDVPTLDYEGFINSNVPQTFNARYNGSYVDINGNFYLTEINFIDGSALTPSSFGETNETTGVWSPIKFNGPWNVGTGVNGFYLKFSNNSDVTAATLGADYSGNGNNWTPSGSPGFSVTAGAGNDSLVDTPTPYGTDTGAGGEVGGNYCTLNPLNNPASSALTNGNLDVVTDSTTAGRVVGTFGMSSGKWYWEITGTSIATYEAIIGIAASSTVSSAVVGNESTSYSYQIDGDKRNNLVISAYGAAYTNNDVIGVALDLDAGTLTFYKNGVSQGTAFSSISGTFVPALSDGSSAGGSTFVCNFGQRPFAYTAPSGFKALVTTNLPEPTVVQGDDYFNTVLYPGNTPSTNAITGVGFAPDWVWVKSRTAAEPSNLVDRVRGDNLRLKSSTTDAESAATFALNSDGFTVGANSESNTGSMVAWNWKANGAGASNEDGTVAGTVTVSANTTAGISIVTWTNPASGTPTIGHGLVVAPSFIIVKDRTFAYNWDVGCDSIGWANRLNLNTTGATSSGFWNSTAPTASVFTYAASGGNSGDSMVAYCFAEVEGFSKFGSYTGNGLADGPFVYTGFRPAFILIKRTTGTAQDWQIMDVKRDTYNAAGLLLQPNEPNLESDARPVLDILSNGFKQRNTYAVTNTSAETYIYAAFAENPFKYSLAR